MNFDLPQAQTLYAFIILALPISREYSVGCCWDEKRQKMILESTKLSSRNLAENKATEISGNIFRVLEIVQDSEIYRQHFLHFAKTKTNLYLLSLFLQKVD